MKYNSYRKAFIHFSTKHHPLKYRYNYLKTILYVQQSLIVLQTNGLFTKKKKKGFFNIRFSVPQVKMLLLLTYFVVFGVIALATLSVVTDNAERFVHDMFRYSKCNFAGYDPKCEDIRRDFEKHTSPGLISSTYLLMGLLSWVHLLFVIQVEHIKKAATWIKLSRTFSGSFNQSSSI